MKQNEKEQIKRKKEEINIYNTNNKDDRKNDEKETKHSQH